MIRLGVLSLLGLLASAPLRAETPAAAPAAPTAAPALACDGQFAILYHSKIKPGGSLDKFTEAVKAQEAWYRAQGITDNKFVVARVVVTDKATKQQSYATDEVYNLHINPPKSDRYPKGKDAPKADYLAQFKANATLVDKKTICLPKF